MFEVALNLRFSVDEVSFLIFVLSIFVVLVNLSQSLWRIRVFTALISSLLIGVGSGLVLVGEFNPLIITLLVAINSYRLFSLLRIIHPRTNELAARRRALKTEFYLSVYGIIVFALQFYVVESFSILTIIYLLSAVYLVLGYYSFWQSKSIYVKSFLEKPRKKIADEKLPSITVAVPARNETYELTECLENILSSDYPKMEVIVLDDCSQDNTSDIIKGYAHKGVRFIKGKMPSGSWLPKNYAYQQLLDDSESKVILFCGSDVRFEKHSIREMVEYYIENELLMLNVLPEHSNKLPFKAKIFQPMRYWRELGLTNFASKFPPALTTCWLADSHFLQRNGGFKAFKNSVRPEKHFAKRAEITHSYRFVSSLPSLGVSSTKDYSAQVSTAIRTRYPEHRRAPEKVFLTSIIMLSGIALTTYGLVYAFVTFHVLLAIILLVVVWLYVLTYVEINNMFRRKKTLQDIIVMPLVLLAEVIMINYSMWAYEFSEVFWKGRNVCLPVLKNYPRLPKI